MKIIMFDGICNLCNSSVLWIIKNDKKKVFKFTSLQSEFGQNFLKERNLNSSDFDSFIFYEPKKYYYTKSTAALKVLAELSFFYMVISKIMILIPVYFRDLIYSFIAKNRYKWFGKKESCMIPTPELKSLFLN